MPVFQNQTPCGLLRFVWFTPLEKLPAAASALAVRAAELIGQAIEREAHVRQVEATREGALLALGLALERRDFETSGHTERVVELCTALGQELGLDPAEMEGLRQGAYLHDLGKLAVPDAVLLKPGKLTASEYDVMRRHAEIGFDVTAHIPALHPLARQVIRHHHERYDGGGYPTGRRGEDIPLVARVFSVVDVFDALVNTRPYKSAWTREEALAEIRSQVGRQFDPGVVDAFERLVRRQTTEEASFTPTGD